MGRIIGQGYFARQPVNNKAKVRIAEAECISLSESTRHVIPLMELHNKCVERDPISNASVPMVRCTAFEDSLGALELAKTPKMHPRTKHTDVKYHYFRQHTTNGKVNIKVVSSKDQLANILTKSVVYEVFSCLRKRIMSW